MRQIMRLGLLTVVLLAVAGGCAEQKTIQLPVESAALDHEAYQKASAKLRRFDPGGRISRVEWSDDGSTLTYRRLEETRTFDLNERKFIETAEEEEEEEENEQNGRRRSRRRGPGRGRQYDRHESPDGAWLAVCSDYNVQLQAVEGEEMIQVTDGGDRKLRYGMANWVYGEELSQNTAMWWAPDSKKLVFYKFDEREVPDFYLLEGLTELRTGPLLEGYSKPGEPNPKVTLLAYDLETGATVPIDTHDPSQDEWYIYNVRFTPKGDEVLFSRTNRHQNLLEVMAANPQTGESRLVVRETQETWQDNRPYMRFLADDERFIWETEKTGWRQFELRHIDGRLLATLVRGEYPAISVSRIDEKAGVLYYTAYSGDHPLNAHLNRVNLDGTDQRRLTREPASHSVRFSPDGKWFISRYETITQPPVTALYEVDGRRIATLAESDPERIEELGYPTPELFMFIAEDGKTDIYGYLCKPRDFDPSKTYPLLIDVYGGPGSRAVSNRYRPGSAVCEHGFIVARIDNRGTGGRGKEFLGMVYQKMGIVDVQDQADGARYLIQRPYIDGNRVGIYGHSYGGFMSALAILKYPDLFHVAVAGSAPSDWRNYDTIYTERYMRTPEENPDGYRDGAPLTFAEQLEGKLLLMHGMMDDNVHPTNAWQLVDALMEAGKQFDIMFYPDAGHGLERSSGRLRWTYFYDHLIAGDR